MCSTTNRTSVETGILKPFLMRAQKETRSIALETKERPLLHSGRTMAESCSTALWKTELGSDERGYLAEELSQQSVDRVV